MKTLVISNSMPSYHRLEDTLPKLKIALAGIELNHTQSTGDLNDENLSGYDAVVRCGR